jgi:hypothetical protein
MTYWKTANYLDTAPNEVYCDNTFGPAGTDRAGNPWAPGCVPCGNCDRSKKGFAGIRKSRPNARAR